MSGENTICFPGLIIWLLKPKRFYMQLSYCCSSLVNSKPCVFIRWMPYIVFYSCVRYISPQFSFLGDAERKMYSFKYLLAQKQACSLSTQPMESWSMYIQLWSFARGVKSTEGSALNLPLLGWVRGAKQAQQEQNWPGPICAIVQRSCYPYSRRISWVNFLFLKSSQELKSQVT